MRLFLLIPLWFWFLAKAEAQAVHILLFDTEDIELAYTSCAPGIRDHWHQLLDKIDKDKDAVCFFTEFDDVGDFDSNEVLRLGIGPLEELFCSDSLASPVAGARPATENWLNKLATVTRYFPAAGASYSVTLISLHGQGEGLDLRKDLLARLAVIWNRTTSEGELLEEDAWTIFHPITMQVNDVWN